MKKRDIFSICLILVVVSLAVATCSGPAPLSPERTDRGAAIQRADNDGIVVKTRHQENPNIEGDPDVGNEGGAK